MRVKLPLLALSAMMLSSVGCQSTSGWSWPLSSSKSKFSSPPPYANTPAANPSLPSSTATPSTPPGTNSTPYASSAPSYQAPGGVAGAAPVYNAAPYGQSYPNQPAQYSATPGAPSTTANPWGNAATAAAGGSGGYNPSSPYNVSQTAPSYAGGGVSQSAPSYAGGGSYSPPSGASNPYATPPASGNTPASYTAPATAGYDPTGGLPANTNPQVYAGTDRSSTAPKNFSGAYDPAAGAANYPSTAGSTTGGAAASWPPASSSTTAAYQPGSTRGKDPIPTSVGTPYQPAGATASAVAPPVTAPAGVPPTAARGDGRYDDYYQNRGIK